MDKRIDLLEEILAEAHSTVARAENQRKEVLEAQLHQRKELVTLQHKANAYNSLQEENERLAALRRSLHEGLRQLLALTRALAGEIRQ